jgi:hypothetical protein
MHRRTAISLLLLPGLLPLARAHHGWSSFDQDRPIYLQGRVQSVRWQNPHVELMLELPLQFTLPADLAQRTVPAQTAPVDGRALLARAQLPRRKDRRWEIELAPLSRMQAWNVAPLKAGDEIGVLGFTFQGESGAAILRAEYLFVDARVYGLRSAPA